MSVIFSMMRFFVIVLIESIVNFCEKVSEVYVERKVRVGFWRE